MKTILSSLASMLILTVPGCISKPGNLKTSFTENGASRFVVQQLPAEYGGEQPDTSRKISYYRLIITCPDTFKDTASVSYINFGIQQSLWLVKGSDTLAPDFLQRISNGKSKTYEYIAAFSPSYKPGDEHFSVYLKDHVFGLGNVTVNF